MTIRGSPTEQYLCIQDQRKTMETFYTKPSAARSIGAYASLLWPPLGIRTRLWTYDSQSDVFFFQILW